MIVYAFDLHDPKLGPTLIPGAPKWIHSDWYDIRAKLSEADIEKMSKLHGSQLDASQRSLLKSVLLDRFKLRANLITRPSLAYELIVAKNGPKIIKESSAGETEGIEWVDAGYGRYHAVSLDALIMMLQMQENCPVFDKTGLRGRYDFE